MLASRGAPWGVLLLVFGSEKAWRNVKPINDGPPGLCRSRNSWFHFHGLAADVFAQPDIFMVEFLVEKTRVRIFSESGISPFRWASAALLPHSQGTDMVWGQ